MHIIKNLRSLTLTCLLFSSASYSAAAQQKQLATAALSQRKGAPKTLVTHGHGAGPADQASPSKTVRRVLIQYQQPAHLRISIPADQATSDQSFSLFEICKKLQDWWNTPTTDLLGH